MGIYTYSVHQAANGKWSWVVRYNGLNVVRGENEAEALAELKEKLADYGQEYYKVSIRNDK